MISRLYIRSAVTAYHGLLSLHPRCGGGDLLFLLSPPDFVPAPTQNPC